MGTGSKYLKPMLTAGSSRVFNCNEIFRKLTAEKVEDASFFRTGQLHSLVVIKETLNPETDEKHPQQSGVGTKLYFPYNAANIYEGGRSVFLHSASLQTALREQFGISSEQFENADTQFDLAILRLFDQLPSLDGFLMCDALELEGIKPNEQYFEVPDNERYAIQEYIRSKIEPLVRVAYKEQKGLGAKVAQLVDKIWEAKDMAALEHFIRAFRFPMAEAPAIFASWKGINYYSFEYLRTKPQREEFAHWLKEEAVPRELCPKNILTFIDRLRRQTIQQLRTLWMEVDGIIREYDMSYANFVEGSDAGPFVDFLRNAKHAYWRMGDSLSKINHAINCWNLLSKVYSGRRMPSERLVYGLEMAQSILSARAAERPDAAMAS